MTSEAVRLNLGSRDRSLAGWLNMDIDKHPGVDIVGDVSDLSRFADESVDEIRASHVLEHFPHTRTLDVLKEWHRVLKENGKLYVAVPDFARGIEIYQRRGLEDWVVNWLYGDQCYATAFHYTAFDERRLTRLLMQTGFWGVKRNWPFDIDDCAMQVSNLDLKPVSLNLEASK